VAVSVSVRFMIRVKVRIFCSAALCFCFNKFGILWLLPFFTTVCTVLFINTSMDLLYVVPSGNLLRRGSYECSK